MGGLSLDDDEEYGISFGVDGEAEASNNMNLCLVGRFLTD